MDAIKMRISRLREERKKLDLIKSKVVKDENKLKLLIMKFECRDVTLTWKFQVRIEMFSVLNVLKARKSRVVYNE